jgi:1,4-alpha-glucan branching enzyme
LQRWVQDLNRFYRGEPALFEFDLNPKGFEWIAANDSDQSVLSFLRKGGTTDTTVVVVCNFTPVPRVDYRVGVPRGGFWREALNSDAKEYAGSGLGNGGGLMAEATPSHGRLFSINLTLPPLAVVFLRN